MGHTPVNDVNRSGDAGPGVQRACPSIRTKLALSGGVRGGDGKAEKHAVLKSARMPRCLHWFEK
jgi:hypothetical protein